MSAQQLARFYRCSFAIQVLISLLFIFLFIKQTIKFFRQEYEQYDDGNLAQQSAEEIQNISNNNNKPKGVQSQSMFIKIGTKMQRIYNRLPFLTLVLLNIVLIASYEYIAITAYLYVLLLVILVCIDIQNPTIKLVTQFIPIIFVLGFCFNVYTTQRGRAMFV